MMGLYDPYYPYHPYGRKKILVLQHKVTGDFMSFSLGDVAMPKPNKQQIRDAVEEQRDTNPHLGLEFHIHTVMDMYDISGLDVAMAFIDEAEEKEPAEVKTGDSTSTTAAVADDEAEKRRKDVEENNDGVVEQKKIDHDIDEKFAATKAAMTKSTVSSKVATNKKR